MYNLYVGKHRKESPKQYKKQRHSSNAKGKEPQGISCIYICYVCQEQTDKPLLWISRHNRSIMYFLCSDYCYREINGS